MSGLGGGMYADHETAFHWRIAFPFPTFGYVSDKSRGPEREATEEVVQVARGRKEPHIPFLLSLLPLLLPTQRGVCS
jgi:hypothetical protein